MNCCEEDLRQIDDEDDIDELIADFDEMGFPAFYQTREAALVDAVRY